MDYQFLNQINSPRDLKQLNIDELNFLCSEIRNCILDTVAKNGGHLAANLGTVELTVAIHRTFDSPNDTIVFDVGHQCYTHKLLTGRYDKFNTIRKKDGISGFIRPDESEHDAFISGHSSTSVSSAFGVCKANQLFNNNNYSIAVLGDGALTGGMVYEAFNNVKKKDKNLIVILNDNKMSISKNRGALSKHLSKIRTRKKYFSFKSGVERFLIKIPLIGKPLRSFVFNIKLMLKNAIYDSNIFESLGFYYMGPIDGHNIATVTEMLEIAKTRDKPVLIHVKTIKGKGYKPAEENPGLYHGVSKFDLEKGVVPSKKETFSSVFGEELCKIAENDDKVCAITAAMEQGTGLECFATRFKERFFDVGIAEQHAVTFTSALASKGLKPVFSVYSTFLQRGYDQIIHDAAIAQLPLTLAVDRAGLVGDDGETHQGIFDVAYLSCIPGIKIYAPSDFDELRKMLKTRLKSPKGVAAIRYPRGSEAKITLKFNKRNKNFYTYGESDTVIVTYGALISEVENAVKLLEECGINVSVIKINVLNPIDKNLINALKCYKNILFYEEGIKNGGLGERVGFELMSNGFNGTYSLKAIDCFVRQGSVDTQRAQFGLDSESIFNDIKEVYKID